MDNINGPTGLIAACGKGVLRTLLCHREKVADLIPLDYPVNLIIAAAWHTAAIRFVVVIIILCFFVVLKGLILGMKVNVCYVNN